MELSGGSRARRKWTRIALAIDACAVGGAPESFRLTAEQQPSHFESPVGADALC
jgi:hypothetical protein